MRLLQLAQIFLHVKHVTKAVQYVYFIPLDFDAQLCINLLRHLMS